MSVDPSDSLAESFARMFAHQPNRATPPAPAGPADPLVAAIVLPLLQSQQISVAGVASRLGP